MTDLPPPDEQEMDADMFAVWDINWDSVKAFLAVATQWRQVAISGLAGAVVIDSGLDYSAVEASLRMTGLRARRRREIFADLQAMEGAALDAFAEVTD